MNFDRLRFVAERAEVGEARESVFAVTIPEQRGSFRRFCTVLEGHSITEFNYRIADAAQANLFVGLQVSGAGDRARMVRASARRRLRHLDLSNDELAKQHLRHMIGGRSASAETSCSIDSSFPERPGALLRFLSAMSPGLEYFTVPLSQ